MEPSNDKKEIESILTSSTSLISKQASIINILLVYLLLFVSGSLLYQLSGNKILVLGFTASLLVWVLFSDRKIKDYFVLYIIVFTGFLLTISVYTGGSLGFASIMATMMKLLLAFFIVKIAGSNFTKTYLKVIVFLAAISLIGYISDTFLLFDSLINRLPQVGDIGYEGYFYVFRFWRHIGRNNSIFFEPGAYQIFLNAALFMLLFIDTKISSTKQWIYITILITALFTTFSTTGFLIFAVMLGLFLLESRKLSASSKTLMVGVAVVIIVIFSTQFYSVFFEKIDSYLSSEALTDNRDRRSLDVLVDIEIFKKHLMGVGFEKYFELFSTTGHVYPEFAGSSNGITKTLAVYGLPFSLFIFSSYYWALYRLLKGKIISFITFGMLMMFFVGESYYVFSPVCLAIIAGAFIYNTSPQIDVPKRY